ncbi:MAG: rhomboid family intramembrane serine protease [Anaerohalosphaeraceae bacterium]
MGIYDRDYQKETTGKGEYFGTGGLFSNVPPITRYFLIINILVFVVMYLFGLSRYFDQYLSVFPVSYVNMLQVWRLFTYQFLHADILHILFNMMMLYFLGPILESTWGAKTYLRFYLISGAVGGVVYTLLVLTRVLGAGPMVGASGAIYGLMAAAAILYPQAQVYLFRTIPMRMKTLLIITIIFSVMNFMGGKNAGGEAAHLSGVAAGAIFVYVLPRFTNWRLERSKGAWQRKLEKERAFQGEVDRILEKVHQQGLGSLTRDEKNTLKEATRREQQATKQR